MRGEKKFLLGVLAAAFLARLGFLAVWKGADLVSRFPHDPYYETALYWLGLHPPLETIGHPPLYPAFLAVLFWIFRGAGDWMVPIFQCFVSSFSALVLYSWGRRIASEPAARLAALWMALDPFLIFFAPQYQSETLFVFLVLCFFLALQHALEKSSPGFAWTAGILGAAASLCRGVFLPYSLFLAAALGLMKRWGPLGLVTAGWTLPILVWTGRNYHDHGALILVSAQSGQNMYEGFTLDREEIRQRPLRMQEEVRRLGLSDPIERDRYFQKKIKKWILENPKSAAKIVFFKLFRYWRPWPYDPYPGWLRLGTSVYFILILVLMARGAYSLRESFNPLLPVYGLFAALTLVHSLYFTSLRYRIPLQPFMIFFASAGVTNLRLKMSKPDDSK